MASLLAQQLERYFPGLLSWEQQERIQSYLHLLKKWSQKISLIQVQGNWDLLVNHVIDCLHVTAYLDNAIRIIDVGSGAGFPGIMLAIASARSTVTSIEPTTKKWAFLQTAKRELALKNFVPLCERYQDHALNDYDVAVSRATWNVPQWLEIGATLVRTGGTVIGMEGANPTDIPQQAARYPYQFADQNRAIIVLPC